MKLLTIDVDARIDGGRAAGTRSTEMDKLVLSRLRRKRIRRERGRRRRRRREKWEQEIVGVELIQQGSERSGEVRRRQRCHGGEGSGDYTHAYPHLPLNFIIPFPQRIIFYLIIANFTRSSGAAGAPGASLLEHLERPAVARP